MTYYQATTAYPAPAHADEVIAFPDADSAYFYGPTDVRSTPITFPRNLTRAYLELYLKGNSCDEFWFGSQPDDYAQPNGLCGGGAFREAAFMSTVPDAIAPGCHSCVRAERFFFALAIKPATFSGLSGSSHW